MDKDIHLTEDVEKDKMIKDLKRENKYLKEEMQYLKETMDKVLGHTFTKSMLDKAQLEYAIQETNKILEKRDWSDLNSDND